MSSISSFEEEIRNLPKVFRDLQHFRSQEDITLCLYLRIELMYDVANGRIVLVQG